MYRNFAGGVCLKIQHYKQLDLFQLRLSAIPQICQR